MDGDAVNDWNGTGEDASYAVVTSARAIGSFTAYITIEEALTDTLEITEHPVESGALMSDHAFQKPTTARITLYGNDNSQSLSDSYQQLLDLQSSMTPITVVTGKRTLDNCMIKSIAEHNDVKTENTLAITCELQQVTFVQQSGSTVPVAQMKNAGANSGTKNGGNRGASDAGTSPPNNSTLVNLSGGNNANTVMGYVKSAMGF